MNRKIKCVCYCRVSTSSKEQLNSFENQKEFFEKYISEHKDLTLYKSKENPTGIYADRGISGTLLHREAFEEMLEAAGLIIERVDYKDVPKKDSDGRECFITYRDYTYRFSKEEPKFSLILVKNTSRFSRNILIADVLRKLSAIGVYVKFLDIDKCTQNESDLTIIQFFQTFDEMFSRDLSRKLLSANQQSRDNQILRTNYDLFGYQYHKRKSRAENNYLTIIPEEAHIVQMIFRLYFGCYKVDTFKKPETQQMKPCDFECSKCSIRYEVENEEGIGFRVIRLILNDYFKFRTRKGKEFAQSTLKHIFENEKFCGYLNNGKWDHGPLFNKNPSPKLRENYEQFLVYRPDLIPPIISKELFDLCTAKREKKAITFHKGTAHPSKYKGRLFCGMCGTVMTHNIGNNGSGLYNCRTKKLKSKAHCTNGNVYEYQVEGFIEKLCSGGLFEELTRKNRWLISTCLYEIEKKLSFIERNRNNDELSEMYSKIQSYTQALSKLYTQQALAETVPAALTQAINEITTELKDLEETYSKLTKKPAQQIKECETLLEICYTGISEMENPDTTYTEQELFEIVSHFVVYSEVQKVRGGMHGPPKVELVPILKTEALLHTKFGIDLDPQAPIPYSDIGFEDDEENILTQLKNKVQEVEKVLETLKSVYFSSMD